MNRASTYCFTEKVKYLLGMEFNTNSTKIIKKLLISCKKVKNEKLQTDSGKEVKNEKLQTGKSLIIIYNNCNEIEVIHWMWVTILFPQKCPH